LSFNRCIVFDIDDTLYLERDYARSGFSAVGREIEREFGKAGFGDIAWRLFESGARGNIFNLGLDQLGISYDKSTIAALVAAYRNHTPDIELLPDARDCLAALSSQAVLGAITDGPPESQRAKVKALGLGSLLDPIIVTWERGERFAKPHIESFKTVEEQCGLAGASCVYVADNPAKDFIGPKKLGWRTVRIRREGGLHFSVASTDDIDLELPDLSRPEMLLNKD
jgi:putative hydrolase of the HAD superfamily